MCESKGFLYFPNIENGEDFLYYQFNTLKGQSGAPVFLRVKNTKNLNKSIINNEYNNFDPSVHNYSYIMIGLHIRRGPNTITPFLTDIQVQQNELESKVISLSNRNVNANLSNKNEKTNFGMDNEINIKEKLANTTKGLNPLIITHKKIMKEQGQCEYNISLKLNSNILIQIQNLLKGNTYSSYFEETKDNSVRSNYIMVNLYSNNILKLKGLFPRLTELYHIFKQSGKLLNVKKKFTSLEIKSCDDIKYRTYHKQIFEYDKEKKLNELILDNINSVGSFSVNNQYCINLEMGLNVSLYSDFLIDRIMNKVSQNQNIDLQQLKQSPIKFSKFLTVAIFVELKELNNVYPCYGEMFETLKTKLGFRPSKD